MSIQTWFLVAALLGAIFGAALMYCATRRTTDDFDVAATEAVALAGEA